MRRATAVLAFGALAVLPALASAGGIELRVGGLFPRANTGVEHDLFKDHSQLYRVTREDWRGGTVGLEFTTGLSRNVELGFHLDGYGRTNETSYREYTRPGDVEIRQTLEFKMAPIGATVRLVPGGRRARVAPYVGAGFDLIFYEYEAWGDFIDFSQRPRLPIRYDEFGSTGVAPGVHVVAGLRVPVTYDFSLVGEVRYQWAEEELGGDFDRNRIDLTGASATLGLRLRF